MNVANITPAAINQGLAAGFHGCSVRSAIEIRHACRHGSMNYLSRYRYGCATKSSEMAATGAYR
jgi:hypothetical protein